MPKRLNDLTRDELLSITDEETEKLLDLEAAFDGITYVPAPSETITEPQVVKDVTVYYLSTWYTTDVTLIDAVRKLLREHGELVTVDYDYAFDYEYKYAKPTLQLPDVQKEERMNMETFEKFRNEYQDKIKLYKKNKSEWDGRNSYISKLSKIRSNLWDAKQSAIDDIQREKQVSMIYDHYLEVAGNDREVALKFFAVGKPDDIQLLESLRPEVFVDEKGLPIKVAEKKEES